MKKQTLGMMIVSLRKEKGIRSTIELILKVVPVAMGVAVVTLSIMKEIDMYSGFTMLGIGLACIGISMLKKEE